MPQTDAMNVRSPLISSAFDELLYQKKRGVAIRQTERGWVQLAILREGVPMDLMELSSAIRLDSNVITGEATWDELEWTDWNTFVFDEEGNAALVSSSSSSDEIPVTIKVRFREASLVGTEVQQVTGYFYDINNGIVRCLIPDDISDETGVYLAEFGVFNPDDELVFTNECYVYNIHTAWGDQTITGPPSIEDVYMSLRDGDPHLNELTEQVGYDVAEIAYAATRTVQYWNDTPPIMASAKYSTKTFPFRDVWLQGIRTFLFELAEEHYRRNRLPYTASGVNIDDMNKFKEYNMAWKEQWSRFHKLVVHRKAGLNMSRGYGSFGSGYGH